MNFKDGKMRFIFLIVFVVAIFIAYGGALFKMQIIDTDYYKEQSQKKIYSTETIAASRGNITDRNGQLLVTNETVYTIKFSRALLPTDRQNDIILNVAQLLISKEEKYYDTLPISQKAPYSFVYQDENAQDRIDALIKNYKLGQNATAGEIMQQLIKNYKIDTSLPTAQKRIIAGVRYQMERASFSSSNPYIFASDISIDTVTMIKELADEYPGVSIDTESKRVYTTPYLASHILGRTDIIYAEEYPTYKELGYKMSDHVGKDGIEKAMEEYLKGTDGTKVIERDVEGKVLGVTTVKEPTSGNTVMLTIDKDLQEVAQTSLEQTIKDVAAAGQYKPNKAGADACAGAAVVVDVNSGEILASASAPNYDLTTYLENYSELSKDKLMPMFNRAFNGTYAPGSTFKMATGIAVLEEGVIGPQSIIRDLGIYTKYAPSYSPRCWIYTDYGSTHGPINVSQALEKSCNYFFYETADKMGIEKLNRYCEKLGLGQKTGVELPEASGVLASPEAKKRIEDQGWFPGDTLQASIGQSYNLFTPLQLANYVATVVNGGTRYKTHLVKSINDTATGVNTQNAKIEVVENLKMKEENYQAIMYGMRLVTTTGTASGLYSSYPVSVGAKTGTASVPSGTSNGVFVAFAPYEDPEIAICVVIEHGISGSSSGAVTKAILDEYFKDKTTNITTPTEQQLIK